MTDPVAVAVSCGARRDATTPDAIPPTAMAAKQSVKTTDPNQKQTRRNTPVL